MKIKPATKGAHETFYIHREGIGGEKVNKIENLLPAEYLSQGGGEWGKGRQVWFGVEPSSRELN
jgi:hypothetical protein